VITDTQGTLDTILSQDRLDGSGDLGLHFLVNVGHLIYSGSFTVCVYYNAKFNWRQILFKIHDLDIEKVFSVLLAAEISLGQGLLEVTENPDNFAGDIVAVFLDQQEDLHFVSPFRLLSM